MTGLLPFAAVMRHGGPGADGAVIGARERRFGDGAIASPARVCGGTIVSPIVPAMAPVHARSHNSRYAIAAWDAARERPGHQRGG